MESTILPGSTLALISRILLDLVGLWQYQHSRHIRKIFSLPQGTSILQSFNTGFLTTKDNGGDRKKKKK